MKKVAATTNITTDMEIQSKITKIGKFRVCKLIDGMNPGILLPLVEMMKVSQVPPICYQIVGFDMRMQHRLLHKDFMKLIDIMFH